MAGRLADALAEGFERMGEQEHVLVHLDVVACPATVKHALKRSGHGSDVVKDHDRTLEGLAPEVSEALAKVGLVADGRDEDRGVGAAVGFRPHAARAPGTSSLSARSYASSHSSMPEASAWARARLESSAL